jgi:TRAP-type mannitol/chloroaromatic compound transport system permease small subunit
MAAQPIDTQPRPAEHALLRVPLAMARRIDALNNGAAWLARWAVLLACLICCGNAFVRFAFNISSNAWLEIQWYLFAVCVMLGAPQVLRLNEHVRVDVLYGPLSPRGKAWVDLFGLLVFLMPVLAVLVHFALPYFWRTYLSGEMSNNAGGLIRWPVVLTMPLGFALLFLQGISEATKRVALLSGNPSIELHYERPLQ